MSNGFSGMLIVLLLVLTSCGGYKSLQQSKRMIDTPWESDANTTPTYPEVIDWYELVADMSKYVSVQPVGMTDAGYPLHEVFISSGGGADKVNLMINNAIHPGEPCGVDASMLLVRDLIAKENLQLLLKRVNIIIIPFYNIGGGLNRGSYSRANQVGPKEHGFRGNAKHLDLNRDFIKADSRNALAFTDIFQKWRPHIFIDTHTSNGADYQYVMTLISTQKDKLPSVMSQYQETQYLPDIYEKMAAGKYEMTPYVYSRGTPDTGIRAFLDLPRYSSGYAALHGALSSMPETHMLKPYADRVASTYNYLLANLEYAAAEYKTLLDLRKSYNSYVSAQQEFAVQWELDKTQSRAIAFKGYEATYKASAVSDQPRLYYDHDQPYEKQVDYYDTYRPTKTIVTPSSYVIPFAYDKVIQRLRANGVAMQSLTKDTIIDVQQYSIKDYKTVDAPYEGHYLHYDTEVESLSVRPVRYAKGSVVVDCNQPANPYIVHTLEPEAADSFFSWNFFDGILMQKEHFSAYVFEDTAARLLNRDPMLKAALDQAKRNDPALAEDGSAQLEWVYKHSPYYESGYRTYPIGRIQ